MPCVHRSRCLFRWCGYGMSIGAFPHPCGAASRRVLLKQLKRIMLFRRFPIWVGPPECVQYSLKPLGFSHITHSVPMWNENVQITLKGTNVFGCSSMVYLGLEILNKLFTRLGSFRKRRRSSEEDAELPALNMSVQRHRPSCIRWLDPMKVKAQCRTVRNRKSYVRGSVSEIRSDLYFRRGAVQRWKTINIIIDAVQLIRVDFITPRRPPSEV